MIKTYCDGCGELITRICVHLGKKDYCTGCGEVIIRTNIPDIDLKIKEIIKGKNE